MARSLSPIVCSRKLRLRCLIRPISWRKEGTYSHCVTQNLNPVMTPLCRGTSSCRVSAIRMYLLSRLSCPLGGHTLFKNHLSLSEAFFESARLSLKLSQILYSQAVLACLSVSHQHLSSYPFKLSLSDSRFPGPLTVLASDSVSVLSHWGNLRRRNFIHHLLSPLFHRHTLWNSRLSLRSVFDSDLLVLVCTFVLKETRPLFFPFICSLQ